MRRIVKPHKKITALTISAFLITLGAIVVLIIIPKDFWEPKKKEWMQSQIIIPQNRNGQDGDTDNVERMVYETSIQPQVPLEDGEIQVAAISEDFDGDGAEEQIIAYRNLMEADNPVYITYIDYDLNRRTYHRTWSAKTSITRPSTLSLSTLDLLGNHENCVIITGMNQKDENTFAAFRILTDSNDGSAPSYKRIADITIDGTISILETARSQSYQMGFTQGASFLITSRTHDTSPANSLDQIEHNYDWDPVSGIYERISTTRILGAQIEAKFLRELLSGGKQEFERYIDGLWYHINAEGAIDTNRYIYFDTSSREVSFYSEDTQQVYGWQSSYATRYGVFISAQNISVGTLNRKIDIELESIDKIHLRVSEDVRMRILMNAPWDGSYRKARTLHTAGENSITVLPGIEAQYNSSLGKFSFSSGGNYRIDSDNSAHEGHYSFFKIKKDELIELVPSKESNLPRQTYRIERGVYGSAVKFALIRVKLGINGIYDFHEAPILLN